MRPTNESLPQRNMSCINRRVDAAGSPHSNAGRFIEESIESVLAQTYSDWELLLIDDGSSDSSTSIARRYAASKPDRIRCLSHDGRRNRGASASRNLGARHASGEFLAFLDADDVYLPRKLEEQVPLLDAHPEVAMLYAATEYWRAGAAGRRMPAATGYGGSTGQRRTPSFIPREC
jgi:glycosyltransferase involved in cell wall biosynthesis